MTKTVRKVYAEAGDNPRTEERPTFQYLYAAFDPPGLSIAKNLDQILENQEMKIGVELV